MKNAFLIAIVLALNSISVVSAQCPNCPNGSCAVPTVTASVKCECGASCSCAKDAMYNCKDLSCAVFEYVPPRRFNRKSVFHEKAIDTVDGVYFPSKDPEMKAWFISNANIKKYGVATVKAVIASKLDEPVAPTYRLFQGGSSCPNCR